MDVSSRTAAPFDPFVDRSFESYCAQHRDSGGDSMSAFGGSSSVSHSSFFGGASEASTTLHDNTTKGKAPNQQQLAAERIGRVAQRYLQEGAYERALWAYEEVLGLYQQNTGVLDRIKAANVFGIIAALHHQVSGETEIALECLGECEDLYRSCFVAASQSLERFPHIPIDKLLTEALQKRAALHTTLAQFEDAVECHEQAMEHLLGLEESSKNGTASPMAASLQFFQRIGEDERHGLLCHSLERLGALFLQLGQSEEALQSLEDCLDVLKLRLTTAHRNNVRGTTEQTPVLHKAMSAICLRISGIHYSHERIAEAIEYQEYSLEHQTYYTDERDEAVVAAWTNLGVLLEESRAWGDALEAQRHLVDIKQRYQLGGAEQVRVKMARNLERLGRKQEAFREYEMALATARRGTPKSTDFIDEIVTRIDALQSGGVAPLELSLSKEGKELPPGLEKDDSTTAETTSDDDALSRALVETQKFFELAKNFRAKKSFSAAKECLKECRQLLQCWEGADDPAIKGLRLRVEGLRQLTENDEAIHEANEASVDAVRIGYAARKSPLTLTSTFAGVVSLAKGLKAAARKDAAEASLATTPVRADTSRETREEEEAAVPIDVTKQETAEVTAEAPTKKSHSPHRDKWRRRVAAEGSRTTLQSNDNRTISSDVETTASPTDRFGVGTTPLHRQSSSAPQIATETSLSTPTKRSSAPNLAEQIRSNHPRAPSPRQPTCKSPEVVLSPPEDVVLFSPPPTNHDHYISPPSEDGRARALRSPDPPAKSPSGQSPSLRNDKGMFDIDNDDHPAMLPRLPPDEEDQDDGPSSTSLLEPEESKAVTPTNKDDEPRIDDAVSPLSPPRIVMSNIDEESPEIQRPSFLAHQPTTTASEDGENDEQTPQGAAQEGHPRRSIQELFKEIEDRMLAGEGEGLFQALNKGDKSSLFATSDCVPTEISTPMSQSVDPVDCVSETSSITKCTGLISKGRDDDASDDESVTEFDNSAKDDASSGLSPILGRRQRRIERLRKEREERASPSVDASESHNSHLSRMEQLLERAKLKARSMATETTENTSAKDEAQTVDQSEQSELWDGIGESVAEQSMGVLSQEKTVKVKITSMTNTSADIKNESTTEAESSLDESSAPSPAVLESSNMQEQGSVYSYSADGTESNTQDVESVLRRRKGAKGPVSQYPITHVWDAIAGDTNIMCARTMSDRSLDYTRTSDFSELDFSLSRLPTGDESFSSFRRSPNASRTVISDIGHNDSIVSFDTEAERSFNMPSRSIYRHFMHDMDHSLSSRQRSEVGSFSYSTDNPEYSDATLSLQSPRTDLLSSSRTFNSTLMEYSEASLSLQSPRTDLLESTSSRTMNSHTLEYSEASLSLQSPRVDLLPSVKSQSESDSDPAEAQRSSQSEEEASPRDLPAEDSGIPDNLEGVHFEIDLQGRAKTVPTSIITEETQAVQYSGPPVKSPRLTKPSPKHRFVKALSKPFRRGRKSAKLETMPEDKVVQPKLRYHSSYVNIEEDGSNEKEKKHTKRDGGDTTNERAGCNSPLHFVDLQEAPPDDETVSQITFKAEDMNAQGQWLWGLTSEGGLDGWFPAAYVAQAVVDATEGFLSAESIHKRAGGPPSEGDENTSVSDVFLNSYDDGASDDPSEPLLERKSPSPRRGKMRKLSKNAVQATASAPELSIKCGPDMRQIAEEPVLTPVSGPTSVDTSSVQSQSLTPRSRMRLNALERRVDTLKKQNGAAHPDVASALVALGMLQMECGEPPLAIETLLEAVKIQKAIGDPIKMSRTLHILASIYSKVEDYESALACYTDVQRVERRVYGPNKPELAFTLNRIGRVYADVDDFSLAMAKHQEALQVLKNCFGEDLNHPAVSQTLIHIGEVYYKERNSLSAVRSQANDYGKFINSGMLDVIARAHAERGSYKMALAFLEEKMQLVVLDAGERSEEMLASLYSMAILSCKAGVFFEAIGYYEQALDVQRSLGCDDVEVATAKVLIATVKFHLGQYRKCLNLLDDAKKVYTKRLGNQNESVADTMQRMGSIEIKLFNLKVARRYLESALAIQERTFGPDDIATLETRSEMAVLLLAEFKVDQAIGILEEVMKRQQKIRGKYHPDLADTILKLGEAYRLKGDYGKAMLLIEESFKMRERFLGRDHPVQAETLYQMSLVHIVRGKFEKALQVLQSVLIIRRETLGERHIEVALTLSALGCCQANVGRVSEALKSFSLALPMAEEAVGGNHPHVGDIHVDKAIIFLKRCQYDQARTSVQRGLEILKYSGVAEKHPRMVEAKKMIERVDGDENLEV